MKYKNYIIAFALLACGSCGQSLMAAQQEVVAVTESGRQQPGSKGHHKHHKHKHSSHHHHGHQNHRRSNWNWNFGFANYAPICAPVCRPVYVPTYVPAPVVYQQPIYVQPAPCVQVVRPVYVTPCCTRSAGFSWGFSIGN